MCKYTVGAILMRETWTFVETNCSIKPPYISNSKSYVISINQYGFLNLTPHGEKKTLKIFWHDYKYSGYVI